MLVLYYDAKDHIPCESSLLLYFLDHIKNVSTDDVKIYDNLI